MPVFEVIDYWDNKNTSTFPFLQLKDIKKERYFIMTFHYRMLCNMLIEAGYEGEDLKKLIGKFIHVKLSESSKPLQEVVGYDYD